MGRLQVSTSDGQEITISGHALMRYRERVRDLDNATLRAQLAAISQSVGRIAPAPDWLMGRNTERCLMLGDDVAMPLTDDGVACTCFVVGGMGDKLIAERREHRRRRADARRRWRADGRKPGDRPGRRPRQEQQ